MATSTLRSKPTKGPSKVPATDNPVGVWIDIEQATIIRLKDPAPEVVHISIDKARHKRILKEGHRTGDGSVSEKKEQNLLDEEARRYMDRVMDAIGPAREMVVFGPAEMGNRLKHAMEKDVRWRSSTITDVSADRMTPNQMVAWVKRYFAH